MLHSSFQGFCGFMSKHGNYNKDREELYSNGINVYQHLNERTLGKRPLAKDKCTSEYILQWISQKWCVVLHTHLNGS